MDAFYYTLQSNASKDYFPTNTPTNFKIHMPTQINLDGDWLVGLVEIHFPAEFESRKRKLPPQPPPTPQVNKRTARFVDSLAILLDGGTTTRGASEYKI